MSFLNPFSDIRAHPFQSFLSALAGAFVPGGGFATHAAFNAYNNHNFNNAANTIYDNGAAQGNQAAQAGFDRPLNGQLGMFGDNSSTPGSTGSYNGSMFDMLGNGGGLFDSMNQPGSMFVPDYGQGPQQVANSPAWGQGAMPPQGIHGPEQRRDYRDGLALNQNVGNYGISPMQVGGQNVIFGSGDPNGRYRNHRDYGG
jgi:hypothetical protein